MNRGSELLGGYGIINQKHIANGDVDFDGVIKSEPHEKQTIIITNETISIMLICFIVGTIQRYYEI